MLGHLVFAFLVAGVVSILTDTLWGHGLILYLRNLFSKILEKNYLIVAAHPWAPVDAAAAAVKDKISPDIKPSGDWPFLY